MYFECSRALAKSSIRNASFLLGEIQWYNSFRIWINGLSGVTGSIIPIIYGCMIVNTSLNIYFCFRIFQTNIFLFTCGIIFFIFVLLGFASGNIYCSNVTTSSLKFIKSIQLDNATGFTPSYVKRCLKPLRPIIISLGFFCTINSNLTLNILFNVSQCVMDLLITF